MSQAEEELELGIKSFDGKTKAKLCPETTVTRAKPGSALAEMGESKEKDCGAAPCRRVGLEDRKRRYRRRPVSMSDQVTDDTRLRAVRQM